MLQKYKRFSLGLLLTIALLLNTSVALAQDGSDPATPDSQETPTTQETPAAQETTTVVETAEEQEAPDIQITLDYEETYEGMPLCLPGIYMVSPIDCLPMGPSETLTSWAKDGITIPEQPLEAIHPDSSLMSVDRLYAKLNVAEGVQAAWYPSLDAAIVGWGASNFVPLGTTLYVSYDNITYNDNNSYVQNEYGEWIRASPITIPTFQGLQFSTPPENQFGWIIDTITPHREPSTYAATDNEDVSRGTVVRVYDEAEADGTTWYMIGINKWVERRTIKFITPSTDAPEGVENGRWIEINLYEQTLSVYENNQLQFATLVSTGYEPYYTQPGLFQIQQKIDYETMTGAFATGKTDYYLLEDVPWTMYYDGPRAMHGAYWRTLFGYEASHGCVNLSIGDSRWLYDWAVVGDWVYVWDPSGETPTDPSFYTVNAAF